MGAVLARRKHIVVLEVCADTLTQREVGEGCLVTKSSRRSSIFYLPFIFEWRGGGDGDGGRRGGGGERQRDGGGRSWTCSLCIFQWTTSLTEVYQCRLSILNYSISSPHPPPSPLPFFLHFPTSIVLFSSTLSLLPLSQLYWIFSPFQMNWAAALVSKRVQSIA